MNNNLTELVFILDRSGSMSGLEADTVGGFNSMIEKQKQLDGKALVSTVLFSDRSAVLHDRVDLAEIKPMTRDDYFTGGCTALMDALGDAIKHISNVHKYAREEDVPAHTLFVITTDGEENASSRYSASRVREIIKDKEKQGWEFLFLAANIDAVETAGRIGIGAERSANYRFDGVGTGNLYETVNDAVAAVRACRPLAADWKDKLDCDKNK